MSVARRLCFIIEEQYRHESLPLAVASQLRRWGHDVTLLEPHATVTPLFDLITQRYDAYVLKTASEGPGLSLLEAAEAAGIPTINKARSIRLVRDKAVAIAVARAQGLPVTPELRTLALHVGAHFGLDLYGVDVVQTPTGWVGVDINDFPSFGGVPGAV